MRRLVSAVAFGIALCVAAVSCSAEHPSASTLLDKLTEAASKLESYDAECTATIVDSRGGKENGTGRLVIEMSQVDGKTVKRSFSSVKSSRSSPDGGGQAMDLKAVNDGNNIWVERRIDKDRLTITKNGTTGNRGYFVEPLQTVETIRAMCAKGAETTVGEDNLDGRKMRVLECAVQIPAAEIAKAPQLPSTWVMKYWFDAETLLLRRTTQISKFTDGHTETFDGDFLDVKVNQKVDPALFKYTPPEGADVVDNTLG